jgi:hypothetical protein
MKNRNTTTMKQLFQSKQPFSLSGAIRKVCANQLQAGSADLIKRRGVKIAVFANDTIGNAINASGFYEWSELEAIFDFLKPLHEHFNRSLALDIGANIGNHSIYFSRYFKAVHAFEPHPLTYRILDINASLRFPKFSGHFRLSGLIPNKGVNRVRTGKKNKEKVYRGV